MKYKKSLLIICLIICLFSIASVCASDVNETAVASEDQMIMESQDVDLLEVENQGDVDATYDEELDESPGTFADLVNEIANADGELNLTRNYVFNNESDYSYISGVILNKEISINGNGFEINGNNQARIFEISKSGVKLSNIKFYNGFYSNDYQGGIIAWGGNDGLIINCSFSNYISQRYLGGAIFWSGQNGRVINCNFINCSVKGWGNSPDYNYGGAIFWSGQNGTVINSSFKNCVAGYGSNFDLGGAIYWSGQNGSVINSNFSKCAANEGDAIYWEGDGGFSLNNNFNYNELYVVGDYGKIKNNTFYYSGVIWSGNEGSLINSNFFDCYTFNIGGAVRWLGSNGTLLGGYFVNCSRNDAVTWLGLNGSLLNSYFINCNEYGSVDWYGKNGSLSNCYFINSSSIEGSGGAVYWYQVNGSLSNCCFINCSSDGPGGAVCWVGANGNLFSCDFYNCFSKKSNETIRWFGVNGSVLNCNFDNNSSNYSSYINATNLNPLLGIEILELQNESKLRLNIILNEMCTGNLTIFIYKNELNNLNLYKKYSLCIEKFNSDLYLNNISTGKYLVVVNYSGDSMFKNTSIYNNVIMSGFDPKVIVQQEKFAIEGENTTIKIILNEDCTGKIKIGYNEKEYFGEVHNGESFITLFNVQRENSYYSVEYSGDDKYNYCYTSGMLDVKFKTNLNLSVDNVYVGEVVEINYSINENATGIISIYGNGSYIKNVSVGDKIHIRNLKAGIYTLKVVYNGDDNYGGCENITKLTIHKLDPYYYIDDIFAGENSNITFVFDEDAIGKVNVSFGYWISDENNNDVWEDNYNFIGQLSDGKVSFTIPDLEGGWIEYIIKYSGDDRYDSLNESDYIWVSYKDSPISIDITEINWSDNVILKPTLPEGATGNIHLLLDNISLANISLGDSFKYKAIKGGKHYLTIEYSGDEYFSYNETTVEFYVNKLNSNFSMESTFDSEKYITVPITLNDDANGFITVNINSNIFSGDVINGSFNFTVTDLGAGAHNAIINYSGDDKYNDIYIAKEITVNLKNSNLDLNISNILKDENLLIRPDVTENATGIIDIYVDDELKRTINVGSSYTLVKPTVGQHKIRLVYSGNTYFDSAEKEFSFRVFTIYPIEAVDTQIVYGTDKKFRAKFYDEYGEILANKYVSFIVNGTEYPIRTNSEGIAVLDVDLGVGEYNITSVSLLDESTTNKLLIFHSIQAESMIIEYGSDTRFKATFLDEKANPLKNTRIVFNIDGKDTMVTTDVDGVAVLNIELAMGTHYITSINTITDENMTNKVVVVSDVDSIITVEAGDISYGQKAIVKVNIDSAYLNANVTVKVTGENGFKQIFTQNASKTITKELSNLNASKYYVDVKYEDSDLLVIQKNTIFNVLKIDPNVTLSINDGFLGQEITLGVNVSDSNGILTVKIDDGVYGGQLVDGRFVMDIDGLSVGQHSFEVLFNGDNNYNPLIKTGTFNIWNNLNFEVDFYFISIYEDDESHEYVHIKKLTDNEDALLTLFIDGIKAEGQHFTIYESDDEYCGEIEFNASNLSEGIHNWKITYYDEINYINSSQSGLVKVYHVGNPDKMMLVTNDGIIADIDSGLEFVKNGTIKIDDDYEEYYTIYSFTADGVEYAAIRWFPVTFYSVSCYKIFNPNEYKSFEGIYYKTTNGLISEVIDSYEEIDGIYYAYVGRPYDYYNMDII